MNKNTSYFFWIWLKKMFQILLYTLLNLFDSTNLMKFDRVLVTIADWFNQLLIVDWFN